MEITKFHEILDFAVEREKEAVQFYAELRKSSNFESHKAMLQEFEDMEKGHILILEKMRHSRASINTERVVRNLKISEYIVPEDNIVPNSYPNILIIAMKREEKSHILYLDLSKRFADQDKELSNLFATLAAEEATHKHKFEKLYESDVLRDN